MALFGNNNREPQAMAKQATTASSNGSTPNQINMIGEGTIFEGKLRAENEVVIRGKIIGTLSVTGRAVVAESGVVDGELEATSADVSGEIKGNIRVQERLVLRGSARVNGNVATGRFIVEEGAMFDGECTMGSRTVKSGDIASLVSALEQRETEDE